MTYNINSTTLANLVKEEASRVGMNSYSEDGKSLYDLVAIVSRDTDAVSRYLQDALSSIVAATRDICTAIPSPPALSFYVPDMDPNMEASATAEVSRFIALSACALWLTEKGNQKAEGFAARAQAALVNVINILTSRKPITLT